MSNIVFLGGRSDTGKTASLRALKNPEGVLYLNFDIKKPPFTSAFTEKVVTDPYTLHSITERLISEPAGTSKFHTLIVDSITSCMALYAAKYIGKDCPNKMVAWGDYGSFYDKWAKQLLAQVPQNVIVLAHNDTFEEKGTLNTFTQAAVQGRLKNIGLEADFGAIYATAIVSTELLKEYANPNLTITEEDELEKFKHVIQTRKTLDTKDGKIRSPLEMWSKAETYINPDVQIILDRLDNFYKKQNP